nr:hypothetical protein [uncultured Mediterranean phage uvMED]
MANNCDEIYNQIQALTAKRNRVNNAIGALDSIDPEDLTPKQDEDVFRRAMGPGPVDKAAEDVAKKRRSKRQRDRFNNAAALADRIGDDQATSLLTLLRGMDETWKAMDPEDYAQQVASYTREQLTDALEDAAQTAGLDLNDGMINAVQANLAPFLPILRNQATLKAYSEIGRAGYIARVSDLTDLLEGGNYLPEELVEAKQAVVKSYLHAVTMQRARNIARTRSGQLLRNERDLVGNRLEMDAVPAVGTQVDPAVSTQVEPAVNAKTGKVEMDVRTAEKIKQVQDDVEAMIGEKVGANTEELLDPDSSLNRVIDAANEGNAGVPELKRITEEIQATSELVNDTLEEGFKYGYEKYASLAWKDSILFGLKSSVINNYASQKLMYAVEGMLAVPRNAATIYAQNVRNPVGTATWRNPMLALTQGSSAATRSALMTESLIKQPMWETFTKDLLSDNKPFSGNVDRVNNRTGQISIAEQYEIGNQVLAAPFKFDMNLPLQVRDKVAWASKVFVNGHIERMTGKKLPLLSALEFNSAVDNRAGLRTFVTVRANQLQMDFYRQNPEATPKAAVKHAQERIAEELYQARPSQMQIDAYRQQFNLGPEVADSQIAETITYTRVGHPLLNTPDRQKAYQKSRDQRMQGDNAQGVPGLKQVSNALQGVKSKPWGDYFVPFLKSWAEQTAWDLGTGGFTATKNILEIGGHIKRGDEVTPEMWGQAASSMTMTATLLTLFNAMESLGDDAPVQLIGTARDEQDRMALRNEGKMENTLFIRDAPQLLRSLPIGNMPLVKTLLLYKDISNAWKKGTVSHADFMTQMGGVLTVFSGLLLRAPGMYQMQWLYRAFSNIQEDGALEKAVKEFIPRFVATSMPTSGFTRTAGQIDSGFTGSDYRSLIDSRRVMEQEADLIEKLPPDHPLKSTWTQLQNFAAAGGTPELVRLMGGRDRKFTYLGRKWNGLDYLPPESKTAWPDGVPALQIGGDFAVESELDRLDRYNEPEVFKSHVLSDIPVTPVAINELEYISGSMVSDGFAGSELRIGSTEYIRNNRRVTRQGPNMAPLLRRLTKGRTWREALNALFTSDEYERWNADPKLTNNGSMTDDERAERPGTVMVDKINQHYTDLLESRFVEAGVNDPERYPGAAQYNEDQNLLLPNRDESKEGARHLRDVTRGRPTAE